MKKIVHYNQNEMLHSTDTYWKFLLNVKQTLGLCGKEDRQSPTGLKFMEGDIDLLTDFKF